MKYRFFLSPYQIKRIPVFGKLTQFICGLIGHAYDGDWGYGGGEYADVWCRHCDHLSQVHKTSIWFKRREAKVLMEVVETRHINDEEFKESLSIIEAALNGDQNDRQ